MTDPGYGVAGVVLGGACGGVLVEVLARRGVMPVTAATAVAFGGGLEALVLRGSARQVAVGAVAASVGRLAVAMLERWVAAGDGSGEVASSVEEPITATEEPQRIAIDIAPRPTPVRTDAAGGDSPEAAPPEVPRDALQEGVDRTMGGPGEVGSVPCPARMERGRDRDDARDRAATGCLS